MISTGSFDGWRKAQSSSGTGNGCVEVGHAPGYNGVRDSKLGEDSPVLVFGPPSWSAFLAAVKTGELDN